jgi:hypothetical protein
MAKGMEQTHQRVHVPYTGTIKVIVKYVQVKYYCCKYSSTGKKLQVQSTTVVQPLRLCTDYTYQYRLIGALLRTA